MSSQLDLDTVDRLLTTTRAVRRRLDKARPVPISVVRECLQLAVQAPSAGDQQSWRWVVVTDQQIRDRIAALYRDDNEAFVRDRLEHASDDAECRRMESVLELVLHLDEVPVLVAAYALDQQLDGLGGRATPPALLYGSVFPAVWSFQLALRSRGLGTVPLSVNDEARLASILGAPADARLAALLPVAYFTGSTFRPAARRPLDEVTYWQQWGATADGNADIASRVS
jgi:nitroreductase